MKESPTYRIYESTLAEDPSSYYWAQINNDSNELVINSSKKDNNTLATAKAFELYCTLESSSGTTSTYNPPQNSSSSVSFSPGGSPSSQPETQSSLVIDEAEDLRHKIKELETAMLGTDDLRHKLPNEGSAISSLFEEEEEEIWRQTMETVAWGDLRGSLCACARAIDRGDVLRAEWLISELRQMVSVSGDPLQRLCAYMAEGLVARLALSGSSIYKALRCKEPMVGPELLSYMHLLYEICPYFKFGYMSANGAIAEALRDEPCVHVIDFQIVQGSQWMILLRALATRPGGPPRVRITGIDDSASAHARGGGLGIVGRRLAAVAEACGIPFEFRAVEAAMADVEASDLDIRPGEALAVNFAMALHHVPDESVGGFNHRDRLLRLVKSLSPKVVTLVEQEANTNTAPFYPRFMETIEHYLAVFESIDVALPRDHKERINIEQHCLARDVVNLIACEGPERVERHEPHGKWRARLAMAGFEPCPLSPLVNETIRALLADYDHKFGLRESDGALYLGWADKPLVVSSAWR